MECTNNTENLRNEPKLENCHLYIHSFAAVYWISFLLQRSNIVGHSGAHSYLPAQHFEDAFVDAIFDMRLIWNGVYQPRGKPTQIADARKLPSPYTLFCWSIPPGELILEADGSESHVVRRRPHNNASEVACLNINIVLNGNAIGKLYAEVRVYFSDVKSCCKMVSVVRDT